MIIRSPAITIEAKKLVAVFRPTLRPQSHYNIARTANQFAMESPITVNMVEGEKSRVLFPAALASAAEYCDHFSSGRLSTGLRLCEPIGFISRIPFSGFAANALKIFRRLLGPPSLLTVRKKTQVGLAFFFACGLLAVLALFITGAEARPFAFFCHALIVTALAYVGNKKWNFVPPFAVPA